MRETKGKNKFRQFISKGGTGRREDKRGQEEKKSDLGKVSPHPPAAEERTHNDKEWKRKWE